MTCFMEMPLLTEKPDRGFLETPNAADLLEEYAGYKRGVHGGEPQKAVAGSRSGLEKNVTYPTGGIPLAVDLDGLSSGRCRLAAKRALWHASDPARPRTEVRDLPERPLPGACHAGPSQLSIKDSAHKPERQVQVDRKAGSKAGDQKEDGERNEQRVYQD